MIITKYILVRLWYSKSHKIRLALDKLYWNQTSSVEHVMGHADIILVLGECTQHIQEMHLCCGLYGAGASEVNCACKWEY